MHKGGARHAAQRNEERGGVQKVPLGIDPARAVTAAPATTASVAATFVTAAPVAAAPADGLAVGAAVPAATDP